MNCAESGAMGTLRGQRGDQDQTDGLHLPPKMSHVRPPVTKQQPQRQGWPSLPRRGTGRSYKAVPGGAVSVQRVSFALSLSPCSSRPAGTVLARPPGRGENC